jgi:hypothetical protein
MLEYAIIEPGDILRVKPSGALSPRPAPPPGALLVQLQSIEFPTVSSAA